MFRFGGCKEVRFCSTIPRAVKIPFLQVVDLLRSLQALLLS